MQQLRTQMLLERSDLLADRRLTNFASRATAEKLPVSTTRTNERIASNRSIGILPGNRWDATTRPAARAHSG